MRLVLNISAEKHAILRRALGADLDNAALEALVIEGYRSGKLSAAEVGQLLELGDRWAVNNWLAKHRVALHYSISDLDADRATLDRSFGKPN
jgi:predicted HTH domain antitoxin